MAKGFHFSRRSHYKCAAETVERSLHFRYKGRRLLKRDMRKLWILRISAAVRTLGGSYSKFINSMKNSSIGLNRKMLAEIAARDFEGFRCIYNKAAVK